MVGNKDQLEDFYAVLKSGTTVATFLSQYDKIIQFVHARGLTENYRRGNGRVKKLRDEISSVARFVRTYAESEDQILFALGDTYPDCVVCRRDGSKRQIEVTVAQALERLYVMKELNEKGTGRGFLGLSDDAPHQEFRDQMGHERRMYSTDEAVQGIINAIKICAENKRHYQGDVLLIEAPLGTLPMDRWVQSKQLFSEKAKALQFCEVYVTGRSDDHDICLQIK